MKKRLSEENSNKKIRTERYKLLRRFESLFETPMIILGFVWIVLLILELLNKTNSAIERFGTAIWIIFIVDFSIKFFLAPEKLKFLKTNVITIISLIVPAFRLFRLFRVLRMLRFSRGIRLVKILGSINRGMGALASTMKRRAFGYVLTLTVIVLFAGAAGMYAFEKDVNEGLKDYGSSLWWTGMILTTMGSETWPVTPEGRILCVFLAIYAFTIFSYVTATIATFFIGRDAENNTTEIAGAKQIQELINEIHEIKEMLKNKS